jgi:hypothetical protein
MSSPNDLLPDDRRELLQSLRAVGEAQDTVDFATRVCQEVLRLVPGIRASYNEVNTAARRSATVVHPDPGREYFERYARVFERHMLDNPIVRHHERTGEGGVVTWRDVDPAGRFFDTALFREFYAPAGIRSQAAFIRASRSRWWSTATAPTSSRANGRS